MKKFSKLMVILLVFAMILPGVAQAAPVVEAEEVNSNVIRLSGADRIKTSVKVSQTAYKDGAESVVIVGYEGEVDALAGTLLAHAKKGPVLFTKKGKLSEDTKTEIARLGAKNVYILGGTAAIEDAVKTELETLKYTVKRISGSNREGTAAAVTKEVGGKTTHVFLARGYGDLRAVLADALAVGPASAKGNMAVLLTRTDKVPAATLKSMKDLGVTNVTIVGGEGAVNSGVKTELETLKYTVDRLSGTTREGTAIAIANKYFAGKANALVANGYGSPDALVGGYLGAAIDAPILFSQANKVSEVTTDYLKANTEKAWILGGEGVVNKEVLNKVLGAVDVKVKESITVTETTKLNKDYKSVKVTGNDIVVDLNGKTVETLTVTGNDTIIKNGTIVNIIVGKDVVNVTLEDIIDDGDGNHEFEGGGAESIILKGSTQLKSKIEISSTTPIQIRTDNLGKGKGITGKVTINTEAAVTIAAPVSELEVKKENKNIKIKAEVGKISALADANITVDKDIKMPTLEKAAGIKATATDSSGKEQDFKENDKLEPTTPVVPTPTPPSTGGGSGDNVAVNTISVEPKELTLTVGEAEKITAKVEPENAANKDVTWSSSDEDVATVDENGKVTAIGAGQATITVTTVDGEFTDTVQVVIGNVINLTKNKGYETIQKATEEIKDGDTLKLIANISTDKGITIDKNIIFDLNEKTITNSLDANKDGNENAIAIVVKSEATIKNGTIITNNGTGGIQADGTSANLTIDKLTINQNGLNTKKIYNSTAVLAANEAKVTIISGNYTAETDAVLVKANGGTVIIEDGTFTAGRSAARNDAWGEPTHSLTINGGTFKAKKEKDSYALFSAGGNAETTVNGGIFNGEINSEYNHMIINDGTFNKTIFQGGGHQDYYIIYGGTFFDNLSGTLPDNTSLIRAINTTHGKGYKTMQEAITDAKSGDTITLLADASGDGVIAPEGKIFTLDLGGHTYTVDGTLVGSTGTETNGFQLLKGSTITIQNGKITTPNKTGAKILIQNYSNLTLDKVELVGADATDYVLSNNFGNTTLKNGTTITAADGQVAFDVYYWPKNGYESVTVEIADGTVKIDGRVEYAHDGSDLEGFKEKAKLTIPSGYNLAAPTGYKWVDQDGKQVLSAVTK